MKTMCKRGINLLKRTARFNILWAAILGGLCLPAFLSASEVDLVKLPSLDEAQYKEMPKNLARWHMNAGLLQVDQAGELETISVQNFEGVDEAVLLGDDEALTYSLDPGEKSIVIALGQPYPIDRFDFLSYSAAGTIDVLVSDTKLPADNRRWKKVVKAQPFSPKKKNNYKFPPIDARYVQLRLNVSQPGDIASLGVYSERVTITNTEFAGQDEMVFSKEDFAETNPFHFDFATAYTGSEIAYLNSGEFLSAQQMIDDDFTTAYEFSPSDTQSMLILDLNRTAGVNSVSLVFESGLGTLEFYILNALPGNSAEDGTLLSDSQEETTLKRPPLPSLASFLQPVSSVETMKLSDEFFENHSPTAVYQVESVTDHVRLDFEDITGRYLLIRWIPKAGAEIDPNALAAEFYDKGLIIYEISLFGDIPGDQALLGLKGIEFGETFGTPLNQTNSPTIETPQVPPASP